MVVSKRDRFNIKNNIEFIGHNCLVNSYKNFFYNRNNYNIFKSDGSFNIKKKDFSIFRYVKNLMNSSEKWTNFNYRKRYLLKKRFKKQYFRIKNYIQKNILTEEFENQCKINSFFIESCMQLNFTKNTKYNLNLFELLYIKIRFILNILYKTDK